MQKTSYLYLPFKSRQKKLVGFEEGKNDFEKMIGDESGISYPVTLVFPSSIQSVSSSYVQGFFSHIIEKNGYASFEGNVRIITGSRKLSEEMMRNIH